MEMTPEQKLMAIMAISPRACLILRAIGQWDCHIPGLDIKEKHLLKSANGMGPNPETAIGYAWKKLTSDLPDDEYLVTRNDRRRAFRWNGFMWAEIDEQEWAERWNWTPRISRIIPDSEGGQ